jgi:hypothetical protein
MLTIEAAGVGAFSRHSQPVCNSCRGANSEHQAIGQRTLAMDASHFSAGRGLRKHPEKKSPSLRVPELYHRVVDMQ